MIISKTPFRVSFFGGGTDLPEYFVNRTGAVISTTINKYIYHTISNHPSEINSSSIKIAYSKIENASKLIDIKHSPFREILKKMNINGNIEIHVISDLPSFSGLGGSSAFTVGLINSLTNYKQKTISKKKLAAKAIEVERNILKESVGLQDQIAASYGGFNLIEFSKSNQFSVHPIKLSEKFKKKLNNSIMLFFTGIKRKAQNIESKKIKNISKISHNLDLISEITYKALRVLTNENDIKKFGLLLNETWKLKRKLDNSVSNKLIDNMYNNAISSGALGGKLLGAGGGGFMLFIVPPNKKNIVRRKLKNFYEVKFSFSDLGSSIIHEI